MRTGIYLCLLLMGFVSACSETLTEDDLADNGRSYYPFRLGDSTIYWVKEINYEADTFYEEKYQLLEVSVDAFDDLTGRTYHRLELFVRADTIYAWNIDSVWAVYKDYAKVIRRENNVDFMKLTFPIENHSSWNGNILNVFGEDEYTVSNFGEDFESPYGDEYTNCFVVTHDVDTSNILDRTFKYEVYSKGKGLVYKHIETFLYVNNSSDPGYGMDKIVGGRFLSWRQVWTNRNRD